MKLLIALDFDYTIVDDNTDTFVMKLSEDGRLPSKIKSSYKSGHWTAFMNKVFEYLHAERDVTKHDYKEILEKIPLTANMIELFDFMRDRDDRTDSIIISDSNSWFIDVILSKHNRTELIKKIFTNPAHFESNDLLKVIPHHEHDHENCPLNMCKGKVLQEFLAEQQKQKEKYDRVCYIGDGGNDLCPALTLTSDDFLFVRKGYALHKKLDNNIRLECNVVVWENGLEIISALKGLEEKVKPDFGSAAEGT